MDEEGTRTHIPLSLLNDLNDSQDLHHKCKLETSSCFETGELLRTGSS